ncbi:RsmB/NOP family class I SAM-dependent RNA methyltransferase [Enterocloster bolteae]|uniref:RsmB/NOP family class I SAM-dependent RNA methyltransferase n=1 Tax=Enterocloster bolteae TaxID=208479 RepID=UPI00267744B1|nr:RsmB/NOP family class I SAM-dependent RNA methyltransferase [Enterocloster bolteae]
MADLPVRFEERMKALLGEEYPAFAASYDKERVQGLRFNSLKFPDRIRIQDAVGSRENREAGKTGEAKEIREAKAVCEARAVCEAKVTWEEAGAAETAKQIGQETGFTLERIPWVKEGYYYSGSSRPGKHPYHEAGLYYIQEPSAMAVVELLDPRPGERVLDLCAAPGGKSSHIASRMKGSGFLLSNEIHPARARILSQNMERMGVRNAVVSNEDAQSLAGTFDHFFHKIVVDAPCSGEGMFRKDEEARSQWSEEHVKMCAARQGEILDHAASMLAPGGRMVYSTCTFAPEENEGTVLAFLRRHPEFCTEQVPAYSGFTKGKPQWAGPEAEGWGLERTFRIMPHILEGEGHFMAVLRKEGEPETAVKAGNRDQLYLDGRKRKEVFRDYEPFIRDTLSEPDTFLERKEYVLFGDQLYLMPADMPDMKGLKILRPGLHMGTLKKNRFEPSHALALALRKEEAQCFWELSPSGDSIIRYLKGEALSEDAGTPEGCLKGWVLVCTGGFSLGWAKYAKGMLKNHYPKGLRWN